VTETEQFLSRSVLHRVFSGPSELRAGWRLLIFLAIVVGLINVSNLMVRRLLHGADDTTLFLVFQVINFLIFRRRGKGSSKGGRGFPVTRGAPFQVQTFGLE
jgi:hypothetical protein